MALTKEEVLKIAKLSKLSFEEKEIENLKNNGAKIVSLGKRILRAETAAIVTGGVIINEFF